ncbi:MAG: P-loop NTPase [Acidobacteriota bacterium]|nr:P-loop NTPase [Acidobacteriota bacterium]
MTNPGTLAEVSQIIAVHSAKGGVGKSTVAANLAVGMARRGLRVGLLDADVHGPSAPTMLGNSDWPDPGKTEETVVPLKAHGIRFISVGNIHNNQMPLIWRGAMVHNMITQLFANVAWGKLDYLFVDMPPGTGDAQLSISQNVPLAGAVVVTTPQELALVDTMRGIGAFGTMKVPILGMIENMSGFVCDDCGHRADLFGDTHGEVLSEEMGFPFLGRIPLEPSICTGGDAGEPFVLKHPDSASARAMEGVIGRLVTEMEKRGATSAFRLVWADLAWDQRRPEPPKGDLGDLPVRVIWQVSADELGIAWKDGETAVISTRDLRLACPCAACVDEWTGKAILDPEKVPADIRLETIHSVGRYGVQPRFTDGHGTGIYHFERLKKLSAK